MESPPERGSKRRAFNLINVLSVSLVLVTWLDKDTLTQWSSVGGHPFNLTPPSLHASLPPHLCKCLCVLMASTRGVLGGVFYRSILILQLFENRQMGQEGWLGSASDGVWGMKALGQNHLHTLNSCTYVFLSIEHEAAIELGELTERHVSISQLWIL